MINALAPRKRRGFSWVWLLMVIVGATPSPAFAQAGKGDSEKTKESAASKKKDKDKAGEEAPVVENEAPKAGIFEVYKDDRAEKALEIFKSIPELGRGFPVNQIGQIKSMAAGQLSLNTGQLQNYVRGMALELINKKNIEALISPSPDVPVTSATMTAVQTATDNLLDPLASARQARNTSFVNAYNKELLNTLPKLLDNNLVARIEAMIVLAQTASPDAIPIFVKELKNKDQTVWVKMWAAKGLTNAIDEGRKVDSQPVNQMIDAAKTIVEFLEAEQDAPWPVLMRGVEALGATRQASLPATQAKAEFAAVAMKYLSNAEQRPEVRAAAARALGLIRINSAASGYNFGLVGYNIGKLAAELGDKISSEFSSNPVMSEYLAGLLVGPIFQAFNGVDDARESGLLKVPSSHPAIGASKESLRQIADLESGVARAAAELIRSSAGLQKDKLKELGDRLAALKAYLEKNSPADYHLVPGGEEFKVQAPAVAAQEAPAEKAQVADAPPAR